MKRHPSLRKLSDDHHGGLVQARRLRRAGAGEAEPGEVARAFLNFWEKDTSPHFREEEEVLLAVYARYGGDLRAGPIEEMLADHARIRGLVMDLTERGGSQATLQEVGERLEAHIQLEERRVFPLMEAALPEKALREIGTRLGTE